MDKLGEGGMTLDKHARVKRESERFGEFSYTFRFGFTTAIGEKDERNAIPLQDSKSLLSSWESFGAAKKHAIDAAGASDELSLQRLLQKYYSKAKAKSGILALRVERGFVTWLC